VGGATRSNVAAFDASTGIVKPWAPPGVPVCRSLVRAAGVLVVGGGLSLRALSPDGSTSWRTPTDGAVLTMVRTGGAVFVGGRFSRVARVRSSHGREGRSIDRCRSRGWTLDPVPALESSEGSFAIDLLVSGSALFVGAGGADYAARFDVASGALAWWRDTSGSVQALELVDAGTLAIGGHFQWIADADTAACGTNGAPVARCARRLRLAALDPMTGAHRRLVPRPRSFETPSRRRRLHSYRRSAAAALRTTQHRLTLGRVRQAFLALMFAPNISSAISCVRSMMISAKPACCSSSPYSDIDRAPAMHPT